MYKDLHLLSPRIPCGLHHCRSAEREAWPRVLKGPFPHSLCDNSPFERGRLLVTALGTGWRPPCLIVPECSQGLPLTLGSPSSSEGETSGSRKHCLPADKMQLSKPDGWILFIQFNLFMSERASTSIPWFTLQMPKTAGVGLRPKL